MGFFGIIFFLYVLYEGNVAVEDKNIELSFYFFLIIIVHVVNVECRVLTAHTASFFCAAFPVAWLIDARV